MEPPQDDAAAHLPTIDADDPVVRDYLGVGYANVRRFAALLAEEGVIRGLIGPREVPRLWDRHVLNSASVLPFLPPEGTVVDIGTGAGLPGVVLACLRPEAHIVLLEPMERRVAWLEEVVSALGLTHAEVVRGRAEEMPLTAPAAAVTARAVAPMDRLTRWGMPLLGVGGVLVAMKGSRAREEVEAARTEIARLGGGEPEVLLADTIPGVTPTVVVRVVKERAGATTGMARAARSRRKR